MAAKVGARAALMSPGRLACPFTEVFGRCSSGITSCTKLGSCCRLSGVSVKTKQREMAPWLLQHLEASTNSDLELCVMSVTMNLGVSGLTGTQVSKSSCSMGMGLTAILAALRRGSGRSSYRCSACDSWPRFSLVWRTVQRLQGAKHTHSMFLSHET